MKIKKYSPKIIFGLDEFMKIGVTFDNFNGILNNYSKSNVTDDNKLVTEKELNDVIGRIKGINNRITNDENFPEFKLY